MLCILFATFLVLLFVAVVVAVLLFRRGYDQLLPYFEDMAESQGWFSSSEGTKSIMEYFDSSEQLREEFAPSDDDMPGLQKWAELQEKVKNYNLKHVSHTHAQSNQITREGNTLSILLQYLF